MPGGGPGAVADGEWIPGHVTVFGSEGRLGILSPRWSRSAGVHIGKWSDLMRLLGPDAAAVADLLGLLPLIERRTSVSSHNIWN